MYVFMGKLRLVRAQVGSFVGVWCGRVGEKFGDGE